MDILKMLGAQDARARRPEFTVAALIAGFPMHAAGVLGPRLNLRVRLDDELGAVYDPALDAEAQQLVVSLATPVSARTRDAVLHGAFRLALLRDRPASPPSAHANTNAVEAAAANDGDDDDHDDAASRHTTELEATERCIAADAVAALALCPPSAAAARNGPPAPSSNPAAVMAVPASFLGMWDAEDPQLVAAVTARAARARPFVAPPLAFLRGAWPLCPRVYPPTDAASATVADGGVGSDALRAAVRDQRRFEAVTGGLEAVRWRVVRAAIDGPECLAEALHSLASSLVRRLQRRRMDQQGTAIDDGDDNDSVDPDGLAYEVAAIRVRLPVDPSSAPGGGTPAAPPPLAMACGKNAALAMERLRRCDAAGPTGIAAALATEFGGIPPADGDAVPLGGNPLGVPRWWPMLLAWECAALEAEHIAAGN